MENYIKELQDPPEDRRPASVAAPLLRANQFRLYAVLHALAYQMFLHALRRLRTDADPPGKTLEVSDDLRLAGFSRSGPVSDRPHGPPRLDLTCRKLRIPYSKDLLAAVWGETFRPFHLAA